MTEYLVPLTAIKNAERGGNKAKNLQYLAEHGFAIPASHVCTWDAHNRYLANDPDLEANLRAEIRGTLDLNTPYAVRSSADLEDGQASSFAGQFQSHLDIWGEDAIIHAIWAIWDASRDDQLQTYLREQAHATQQPRIGVLIQEMIKPQISGVAFSKNPITGMNEVIVEAVQGSGQALVQEGATPERWINKWGAWLSKPSDSDIPQTLITEIVTQTKRISAICRCDIDLEWVYDGSQIYWVQLRKITAMDIPVYSNRISREVFPGIIKPLIWSVNVPLVNGAWIRLLSEAIGANDLEPSDLAGHFYYRAYFNMGTLGRIFERLGLPNDTLELLLGVDIDAPNKPSFKPSRKTYRLLPRMILVALEKLTFGRQVRGFLRSMERRYRAFQHDLSSIAEEALLIEIDQLYRLVQEGAYFNIVTLLLALLYNRLLQDQLSKLGIGIQRLDLTANLAEMHRYDPNWYLARLNRLYREQSQAVQSQITQGSYADMQAMPNLKPFQDAVARFLADLGHLSDSGNDFSQQPWRETPELILRMIADYRPVESNAKKVHFDELGLPKLSHPLLSLLYRRARQFAYYREAVSSLYTYGYGLFRDLYLALGQRFTQQAILSTPENVFYLYDDEVREIVSAPANRADYQTRIATRQTEIEAVRDAIPPTTIYGDTAPPPDQKMTHELEGVPTSRGYYTGPVKVLHGLQDFPKLQDGDVLAVPFSDAGWTPLFAQAGAVISEAGGILSHSSIVAREYGIPAIVSVTGACQLADGTNVTVDGFRGKVIIHDSS